MDVVPSVRFSAPRARRTLVRSRRQTRTIWRMQRMGQWAIPGSTPSPARSINKTISCSAR